MVDARRSSREGSDRSEPWRRRAIEGVLVVAAFLLALHRTREHDFWFHLAAGRSILEHGVPTSERWCLAAFGQWPWLGEWFFHVALHQVREWGGDLAVGLWRGAWSAIAMALALALARTIGGGLGAAVCVTPLVLAVTRARMAARPEQVTAAFALLYLLLLERARRTDEASHVRASWSLWAVLIPTQIVWVNLHPGWILGPLLVILYAAVEALRRSAGSWRRATRWLVLALALYACGAATPRPLDTLTLRLGRDVVDDPTVRQIEELRTWSWREDRLSAYNALLALAALAAIVGGARAARSSPALTLAVLGGLIAGLALFRLRALGAMAALPLLAVALDGVRARPWRRIGLALAALAGVAGIAWLVADAKYFPAGVAPLEDSVPVRAVAVADSLGLDGPVLNTPWYGGYILWVRGERHLPIQDARNLGSPELRSRLARARYEPAALDTLLAEWKFTHAILAPPASSYDRMAVSLFHRPEWALVFADDAALLFVRRDRAPAATLTAYRLLTPDYGELGELAARAMTDSALSRALTAELVRARDSSPWNARAHLWLGLMALGRGEAREALAHFDHVERVAPITPGLALRQGVAMEMLGDRDGARRAYRRALKDTSDAGPAREALTRLR